MANLELEIDPIGRHSKVRFDGVDLSHIVSKAEITAHASGPTSVVLHCYMKSTGPFKLAGQFVVEEGSEHLIDLMPHP